MPTEKFLNCTVELKKFNEWFRKKVKKCEDLTPILTIIGNRATNSVLDNFKQGGRPRPWKPVKYPSMKSGTILNRTGNLSHIHYQVADDGKSVTIMSGKAKYAAIHQFGGVIVPKKKKVLAFKVGDEWVHAKSVRIPARPYMMLQVEDIINFKKIIKAYLADQE